MTWSPPDKVLITGGREVGGLSSFAEGLKDGFDEIGVPSEIVRPAGLVSRAGELRSKRVLKVLSTSGMLAVPFARRAICVAHTVPLATEQGWCKLAVLISSFKLANASSNTRVVAVSDYVAVHLHHLFKIRIDGTIHNPLSRVFLEPFDSDQERSYITFVGRLVPCKRLELLLAPICDLLTENPSLRCCIVGDGPARRDLQARVAEHPRIEFVGSRDYSFVRDQLRRSKIFISGCANEGMGIAYLEALSQGCIVAMPATGGGVEIALERVGKNIQLLPISLKRLEVLSILRRTLRLEPPAVSMESFTAKAAASAYLDLDSQFVPASATVASSEGVVQN